MFDRYVRLAQARKARRDGHFEEVLRLLEDPAVRGDRRAAELRDRAIEGLLERAARRATLGAFQDALADCDRVLAVAPGRPAALDQRRAVETERDRRRDAQGRGSARLQDCRDALAAGDPTAAATCLETAAAAGVAADEVAALRARIDAQQQRAADCVTEAERALAANDARGAFDALGRARALDTGSIAAAGTKRALIDRVAEALAAVWRATAASDGHAAAWRDADAALARVPELEGTEAVRGLRRGLRQAIRQQLFTQLREVDLDAVAAELRILDRAGFVADDADEQVLGLAREAVLHRDGSDPSAAAESFARIAATCRSDRARAEAARWRALADECDAALERVRSLGAEGRGLEARSALVGLLEKAPRHPGAAALLERVDRGLRDRDDQLASARAAIEAGELEAASRALLALAVPGAEGEAARVLLRDVQRRTDQVERGIRDVLRRLHGRESARREGLCACRDALTALRAVQVDHPELSRLTAAIAAEIEGHDALDAAALACEQQQPERCAELLAAVAARRGELLTPERLDARRQAVTDAIVAAADTALDHGRPRRARGWVAALAAAGDDVSGARRAELEARAATLVARAHGEVAAGRAALAAGDLGAAETCVERARECGADDDEVRRFEQECARLGQQSRELRAVEDLAAHDDAGAAAARLGRIGPTPALLRTRIYDLKRDLVRRQGLGDAFLLRVDEGGEFLVFRGESVSIGNLRDRRADLPVLANLSGVHARLCRTLSFHGGQRDRIRAEAGEVFVDGATVTDAPLVDGARFRLGDRLEFEYRLPSARSLTAALRLRGDFRIAGTERLLWLKDRGRDGRIVLGAARDAHVPVESATSEVELFADRDGRVRVACRDGGTIDGAPFRDEHPLDAGAVVSCAGVTFVLTAWQK